MKLASTTEEKRSRGVLFEELRRMKCSGCQWRTDPSKQDFSSSEEGCVYCLRAYLDLPDLWKPYSSN